MKIHEKFLSAPRGKVTACENRTRPAAHPRPLPPEIGEQIDLELTDCKTYSSRVVQVAYCEEN